ncbi:MAG: Gfo/Idh/MocA family oxidoreductase [Pirellulaceae bacterium]
MKSTRRQFIKRGAQAAAVVGGAGVLGANSAMAATASSYARISGSNRKLRMAVIGFGGRGKSLIGAIRNSPDADLVALSDCDSKILNEFDANNSNLVRHQDFRNILDDQEIDAIASATPNHWHTLVAMLGCQAGKHVYIEKPISHNMYESQQVVAASAKIQTNCSVRISKSVRLELFAVLQKAE